MLDKISESDKVGDDVNDTSEVIGAMGNFVFNRGMNTSFHLPFGFVFIPQAMLPPMKVVGVELGYAERAVGPFRPFLVGSVL